MPLTIVRNNILHMEVDAIVNPTNPTFKTIGGLDKQIQDIELEHFHRQASVIVDADFTDVYRFTTCNLQCKYIYNVISPIYIDGYNDEEYSLRKCYKKIIAKAYNDKIESIAIPILSSGFNGFDKELAVRISKEELEILSISFDIDIYLVVYDLKTYKASLKYYDEVFDYLKDNFKDISFYGKSLKQPEHASDLSSESICLSIELQSMHSPFQKKLFQFMDASGESNSQIYNRVNIDRKLFNKINSNVNYHPSKKTVLAFCIALYLNVKQTKELLDSAGYSLSKSIKRDVIVEFFIKKKVYDIYIINNHLFTHDEKTL